MDFSWTDEQLAYKKAVIEFAQKELNRTCSNATETVVSRTELWKNAPILASTGCHFLKNMAAPMRISLTTMLTMEGLGYGCRR
jgi:hypothetical protein